MDISLFSLLFYYVNSNSKRFGNSSMQNTKNSWKQSSVSSIAVVGSTKRQKKRSSLTLSAFVVSCCAQQLFELIQQFRIIEKFRENEAVLLLNCGLGSTKRLPVFAFNVSCCAQQLFELIKHLRTPIEQIKMKGGAHFKLQR